MSAKYLIVAASIAALGLAAFSGAVGLADPPKKANPAQAASEPKLPPGWTEEEFKAFVAAATPGKMHEFLAQEVGQWHGKNTIWAGPGAEPVEIDAQSKVTSLMDGRFTQCEMAGEMPGMGPYRGLALYGFDNISQKFVSTWIDNMSTSVATGEGELSPDGKTLTWTYHCNCPLQRKPIVLRQVEKITGPGKKTLEMFGPDHKTGKEYKMMRIELTKKD